MCLAIPAQIVTLAADHMATVDLHGNRVQVSLELVPDTGVGQWVLIHAGFAIQTLSAEEAAETWAILRALPPETPPPDSPEARA